MPFNAAERLWMRKWLPDFADADDLTLGYAYAFACLSGAINPPSEGNPFSPSPMSNPAGSYSAGSTDNQG
jgi:hypothetical protein